MGCLAGMGQGRWVLLVPAHCTVGMPWLSLTWCGGLWRLFVAMPAASLTLLPWAGPPWGWADTSWGGGMGREGGKLSWKQVTCARWWWEWGLPWRQLLQIASFIPPPAPGSLKQPETAVKQRFALFIYFTLCLP